MSKSAHERVPSNGASRAASPGQYSSASSGAVAERTPGEPTLVYPGRPNFDDRRDSGFVEGQPRPLPTTTRHPIPLPAFAVDQRYQSYLRKRTKNLLNLSHDGFPGSHTVPFTPAAFEFLDQEDYFVSEQADGVRYIMHIVHEEKRSAVFMADQRNHYFYVRDMALNYPCPGNKHTRETIIDGELVVDTSDNQVRLHFQPFDVLVLNSVIMLRRSLSSRLGLLRQDIIQPYMNLMKSDPNLAKRQAFTISIRKMERSYGVNLLMADLAKSKHPSPGLRWKPPDSFTADFKIQVQYSKERKPVYKLLVGHGGSEREFTTLQLEAVVFQQWRNHPPDNRIVTCRYDPEWKVTTVEDGYAPQTRRGGWRFLRFRVDRMVPDDDATVLTVVQNSEREVPREEFDKRLDRIRANWKARERAAAANQPPSGNNTGKPETPAGTPRFTSPMAPSATHESYFSTNSHHAAQRIASPRSVAMPPRTPGNSTHHHHSTGTTPAAVDGNAGADRSVRPLLSPTASTPASGSTRSHSTSAMMLPKRQATPPQASRTKPATPTDNGRPALVLPPQGTSASVASAGKRKFDEHSSPASSPALMSPTQLPARVLSQSPAARDPGKYPKLSGDMRSPLRERASVTSTTPTTPTDPARRPMGGEAPASSPLQSPREASPQNMRKGSSLDGRLHLPRSHVISTKLSSLGGGVESSTLSPAKSAPEPASDKRLPALALPPRTASSQPPPPVVDTTVVPASEAPAQSPKLAESNGKPASSTRGGARSRGRGRGRAKRSSVSGRSVSEVTALPPSALPVQSVVSASTPAVYTSMALESNRPPDAEHSESMPAPSSPMRVDSPPNAVKTVLPTSPPPPPPPSVGGPLPTPSSPTVQPPPELAPTAAPVLLPGSALVQVSQAEAQDERVRQETEAQRQAQEQRTRQDEDVQRQTQLAEALRIQQQQEETHRQQQQNQEQARRQQEVQKQQEEMQHQQRLQQLQIQQKQESERFQMEAQRQQQQQQQQQRHQQLTLQSSPTVVAPRPPASAGGLAPRPEPGYPAPPTHPAAHPHHPANYPGGPPGSGPPFTPVSYAAHPGGRPPGPFDPA
ncbi:hypothetical protein IWQ60_009734, partial [Tieghemiomyces parasiticus]